MKKQTWILVLTTLFVSNIAFSYDGVDLINQRYPEIRESICVRTSEYLATANFSHNQKMKKHLLIKTLERAQNEIISNGTSLHIERLTQPAVQKITDIQALLRSDQLAEAESQVRSYHQSFNCQ